MTRQDETPGRWMEVLMNVRTLMAAAAIIGIPGVAMADGMPSRAGYDNYGSPTWSGAYAGFQAGGGWGDAAWTLPAGGLFNGPAGGFSASPKGGLVGAQFGFNHQIGPLLIGVETSLSGGNIQDKVTGPAIAPAANFRTDAIDLFTATGRIGLALDKVLIYGKGGYAHGDVQWGAFSPGAGETATGHRKADGWVAGGGLEYRLRRSLVLGVEYSYVNLDNTHITATSNLGNPFVADLDSVRFHTVTARLSILLDRDPTATQPLK
jgi:outer membrane immunogenic protein